MPGGIMAEHNSEPPIHKESVNKYGANSIIREFFLVFFTALLLFLPAGRLDWLNAWIYISWLVIFSAVFMAAMAVWNPGLLNIRGAPRKAIKSGKMPKFDWFFFAFYVPLFLGIPIVAAFDVGRFLNSNMSLYLNVLGLGLVIIGETIFGWAMVVNRFFHGTITIQSERGHHVITSGPYNYVRHPGYLGQMLYYLGLPFLLGSWWAFLLGLLMNCAFIGRTAYEDRVLRARLDGYEAYTQRVRKRLLPKIW
jgi:protein-S-isoprenylcysteine O-methyltransferase Ste14